MAKVESLFAKSVWSGLPVATHPLACNEDKEKLLNVLRKVSPLIGDHLKIDATNIKKHPEIQKVLDNHSRGSAYFRQFFKRPLVAECDCVACREGMFSRIIRPVEAYKDLHENFDMPLPIPKPSSIAGKPGLHYMSFEEAVKLPFTDEHQPSLQNRRRNKNVVMGGGVSIGGREMRTAPESDRFNKITQGKYIRGVVSCKDCMKPRCIYSVTSPNNMKPHPTDGASQPRTTTTLLCREYDVQQFESAENNAPYVCGMQPFDADDIMHGVIVTREGLECHHPVEFEYYSDPKQTTAWFDAALCAYCTGFSGAKGFIEDHLSIEWKSVLPVCQLCRADGALPLARTKRRNGEANARRAQRDQLTSPATQASVDCDAISPPSEATDISPPSNATRTSKRGRKQSNLAARPPRRATRARV